MLEVDRWLLRGKRRLQTVTGQEDSHQYAYGSYRA
jgi:hypothetical protein